VRLIGKSFPNIGIEILLHDLSNPSHSLVVLENNVTGRNLRDGATNLLIDLKKRYLANEDKLNYELNIGARKFKCTSIPIVRKEYGVVGAICINVDALLGGRGFRSNSRPLVPQGAPTDSPGRGRKDCSADRIHEIATMVRRSRAPKRPVFGRLPTRPKSPSPYSVPTDPCAAMDTRRDLRGRGHSTDRHSPPCRLNLKKTSRAEGSIYVSHAQSGAASLEAELW